MRTRSAAVARAFRSVVIICGARMPNALKTSSMSSRSWWLSPILIGGRFSPSWKRVVADTGIPPGSTAPVSVVWLAAPAQAISFPSWKIGSTITWSGLWMPPYSASLANQMSPSRTPGFSP